MISANISNQQRKRIYARDGYRCALCDSTKYIQIHHYISRSRGGNNGEMNLITLCSECHQIAHGSNIGEKWEITREFIEQAIVEYLADYYAPEWNPYALGNHPLEER